MAHEIHDPHELLEFATGLRALAIRLVGTDQAEDLVQDTWLRALERPPGKDRPPGPWLVRVLMNSARTRYRKEARRANTEALAEPGAGTRPDIPTPAEISGELDAAERLMSVVGELEEAQRTAISLRYFRGLDSREIGDALGIPPSTVRWQLQRALAELRRRLKAEGRDLPGGWVAGLAPLLRLPEAESAVVAAHGLGVHGAGASARASGGSAQAVTMPWAVSGAVVAVLIAVVSIMLTAGNGPGTRQRLVEPVVAAGAPGLAPMPGDDLGKAEPPDGDPGIQGVRRAARREARPAVGAARSAPSAEVDTSTEELELDFEQSVRLIARLVDASGDPLPGAELALAGGEGGFGVAGPDGMVELLLQGPATGADSPRARLERAGGVIARAKGHATAAGAGFPLLGTDVYLGSITLHTGRVVDGVVVDAGGRPVAGASVSWASPWAIEVESDEHGRFHLKGVPSREVELVAIAAGFAPGTGLASPGAGEPVRLALGPAAEPRELALLVLDPEGGPVPNAVVETYANMAPGALLHTDARGELRLDLGGFPVDSLRVWDREGVHALVRVDNPVIDGVRRTVRLGRARFLDVQVERKGGGPVEAFHWELLAPGFSLVPTLRMGDVSGSDSARIPVGLAGESAGAQGFIAIMLPDQAQTVVPYDARGVRDEPLLVSVPPSPRLTGKVVHGERPVEDAAVTVVAAGTTVLDPRGGPAGPDTVHQATLTQGDGTFELIRPTGQPYTVGVMADGLAPFLYLSPGMGRPKALDRIELTPGGTLIGRLGLGQGGACLPALAAIPPGCRVEAVSDSGAERSAPLSHGPGYLLYGLEPGRWTVTVQRELPGADGSRVVGEERVIQIVAGALSVVEHPWAKR